VADLALVGRDRALLAVALLPSRGAQVLVIGLPERVVATGAHQNLVNDAVAHVGSWGWLVVGNEDLTAVSSS
jgi:hypothetical protein